MKSTSIIITILLLVIVGLGAFFAGLKYQQSRQPNFSRSFNGMPGRVMGGSRAGLRPVTGELISRDEKSITVKLPDGGSRIVLLSDKTNINKTDRATGDDLKTGEKVTVFGQENPDGSFTAQAIQLNPPSGNNIPAAK